MLKCCPGTFSCFLLFKVVEKNIRQILPRYANMTFDLYATMVTGTFCVKNRGGQIFIFPILSRQTRIQVHCPFFPNPQGIRLTKMTDNKGGAEWLEKLKI